MPGSAVLDPNNFVDSLIGIVDDVRKDIKEGLGFRQFNVHLVTVTRTNMRAGDPRNKTVTETLMDPLPRVNPYRTANKLEACGLDEAGVVEVTEISMTYTEDELTGKSLGKDVEFYWKISDAQGQATCTRYFTVERDPYPERECCPQWKILLRLAAEPV